jgi:dolichol-phosphate mannosyltransferase
MIIRKLIIIPTYNEKENIEPLIKEVLGLPVDHLNVLVVDDSSPDGTAEVVKNLQSKDSNYGSRLNLLVRKNKEGLGKAYVAGFKWGIENNFNLLVEMDADFSHRPYDLVQLLKSAEQNDFAVGSRYVSGGATKNWGLMRKIISRGGSLYSRLILGFPLNDWTGGFNAWKSSVLTSIGLDTIKSNGYSFQIELKYKALSQGFTGVEVPILFEDRRVGKSKMTFKIVIEAFYKVWMIRFG